MSDSSHLGVILTANNDDDGYENEGDTKNIA